MSEDTPTPHARREAFSRLLLQKNLLTLLLALYAAFLLFSWAPHYLTWPWWSDHDVFATAALSWNQGLLPYRDIPANNFPGTTYLFYLLGITCGWGRTSPLWAFDLTLLLLFVLLLLAWTRARFASLLPGMVASVATLSYYLNQDYSQAAQRDWHAPLLALASLMMASLSNRSILTKTLSGLLFAIALSIRPQAILLAPALAATLLLGCGPKRQKVAALLSWSLGLALGTALVAAPLVYHHLITDFLQGIRQAAYGSSYSQLTPLSFLRELIQQSLQPRFSIVALMIAALAWPSCHRNQAIVTLLALAGVSLYSPLSPAQHAYLSHPLALTWCWSLATLAALVLDLHPCSERAKLVALTLLIALAAPALPRFANIQASLRSLKSIAQTPPGYTTNPEAAYAARYDWNDYHSALQFLRQQTRPDTRVANALRFAPAITGPSARLSAFPAESTAWLTIVHPEDEASFANQLQQDPTALVIWDPTTPLPPTALKLPQLEAAIRANFEPWKSFGPIEIWRGPGSQEQQSSANHPSESP